MVIDRAPLQESEAGLAFAAGWSALGQWDASLADTGAPLLAHVMAALFWLFGASDVAARLPAWLAGVGLILAPALLSRPLGAGATLLAAVLFAASPIAVHLSRVADPAMVTAALAALVVGCAVRVFTDRPAWGPWALAGGLGLSLAHHGGVAIALGAAALAAVVVWGPASRDFVRGAAALAGPAGRGPVVLGVATAIVGATGGLMDLSGVGFPLGPLWGDAGRLLSTAALPTRNILAILAYGWPVLVLAIVGLVLELRQGNRLALFLAEWALLLLVVAAAFGGSEPTFAALPLVPLSLLAGLALSHIRFEVRPAELDGGCWAAIAVALAAAGAAMLLIAHRVGGERATAPLAFLAFFGTAALLVALWRRYVSRRERAAVLAVLGGMLLAGFFAGNTARLSFGGSPPGAELLGREETDPAFRAAFRELTVLASADPSRVLVVDSTTPATVRWYGRGISQVPSQDATTKKPYTFVEPGPGDNRPRTPWKTESQIDAADFHPMGLARWVVSQSALVKGKPRDIIITR
jgi:4-amino-4-deoxy-L-arabinose transferase-like glycosyltransferase